MKEESKTTPVADAESVVSNNEQPAPNNGEIQSPRNRYEERNIDWGANERYLPSEDQKILPKILINGTTVFALSASVGKDHYIEYYHFGSWHFTISKIVKKTELIGELVNDIKGKNTQKPFWELTESAKLKVLKCFKDINLCDKKEALKLVEPIFTALTEDEIFQLETDFNDLNKNEKKKSVYEWAEHVASELHIVVDDNGESYVYKDGVYVIDKKAVQISNFYRDTTTIAYRRSVKNDIIDQLTFMKQTDYHLFNPDRNIANLKNGLLNLKTGELKPHTPTYISTIQIPHNYIPNGKSEKIDLIISGILKPDDIKALKEFIGYCMTLKINFKIAVMLKGDRHSGKTTIQKIIMKIISELNISLETLQGLSGKFNMYNLKNKTLNMADELPSKTIYDNAPFKTITGGVEFVRGEEKGIQAGYFRQTGKLLFSANKVPESFDKEDIAYLVRWKLISCENHFDPNDDNTNKNILDDVTEEDYAKFASECIELFMEVMKRGNFSGDKSEDEKIKEYLMASNHVAEFAKILEEDDDDYKKSFMYNDVYVPWCEYHGIKPKANNKFFEDFKKEGYSIGRPTVQGKKLPALIYGVKVKDEWDELLGVSKSLIMPELELQVKLSEIGGKNEQSEQVEQAD